MVKGLSKTGTSEMLLGTCWDTLDDCCGWANWWKMMGLSIFLSRLATYHTQAAETRCDFDKFDESLRQENKVEVIQWEKELTAWAADKTLP